MFGWIAVLVGLAACAGGAIAAAAVARPPDDLKAAPETSEIAVGNDRFDDAREVQLRVTGAAPVHLVSPSDGRMTTFVCAQGTTVSSGDSPLSIDGRPVLALATAAPLWRDLTSGARGSDVRALQDELARIGYPVASDGVMGPNTFSAANAAFERAGVTQPPDTVPLSSIVWIPAPTVTVATCDTPVGTDVQRGDVLAAFASVSAKVSMVDLPTDLVPGERVIRVGEAEFHVEQNGDILVPDIAALAVDTVPDAAEGRQKPIQAQLLLADPVAVSVVPPGAVYDLKGMRGCVMSKGKAYRVDVVGSQLGETVVEFSRGQAVPTTVETPPRSHSSCG